MSYQTFNVTGPNNYTIYNIQARTDAQACRIYREQTGRAPMKCVRIGFV